MLHELCVHQLEREAQNEELRRAQQELDASQARYFDLYDLAPVGYVTVDAQGLILEANLTTANLLGAHRNALTSQPISRFILSEDQDLYSLNCMRIAETGSPKGWELRMVRDDGTPFWAHMNVASAQERDGSPMLRVVISDVTERKRGEAELHNSVQQYKNLASFIRVGMYIMRTMPDGTYKLDYASPRMAEILGTAVEGLLADPEIVPRLIHPDDLDSFSNATREGIRGKLPFAWDGRAVIGEALKWLHFESSPEPMACGDTQWHGFVVDITERKQLETERAKLEALNRQTQKTESLTRMGGAIAHHFNNRLQSVMANLELIGELPRGADRTQPLARAKQATEKAAEVSRLMLLYLGQTSLERQPRFLSEVCCGCLPLIQSTLPNNLIFETDCPFPGSVINANADQIQHVLLHLITNAQEAIGENTGCIRLRLYTCPAAEIPTAHRFPIGWQPQSPDFACLEVTDTGCGIAGPDLETLFDPFFSTKFVGRGLGLPVVLGIVQAHGGAVTVESTQGQGTAFRVYWPVSTEAVFHPPEEGILASRPKGDITILLVDDDVLLLESIGDMIERMGFTVFTAKDGLEALELYRQHQAEIRCVITDLTMPRMDGWETLTALRQLDPTLPVILASGYDKAQVLSGDHPDRPQAFLSKPYGAQQLRDALSRTLMASGITALGCSPQSHT